METLVRKESKESRITLVGNGQSWKGRQESRNTLVGNGKSCK